MNYKPCVFFIEPLSDMGNHRRYIPLILFIYIVAVCIVGCKMDNSSRLYKGGEPGYQIIGYVGSGVDLASIDASLLTHINYAFVRIDESGALYFVHENGADEVGALIELKKVNPFLKVLISIGGWEADYFSDVALTDSSRTKFAMRVGKLIEEHSLDGVDLDWEFPGQPGPGIKYRKEDKQNFTLLLKAVREQLDLMSRTRNDAYLLTIATNDDARYFENTEMEILHHYVDYINVMSYDFYTISSHTTGHHSGLYQSQSDSVFTEIYPCRDRSTSRSRNTPRKDCPWSCFFMDEGGLVYLGPIMDYISLLIPFMEHMGMGTLQNISLRRTAL